MELDRIHGGPGPAPGVGLWDLTASPDPLERMIGGMVAAGTARKPKQLKGLN